MPGRILSLIIFLVPAGCLVAHGQSGPASLGHGVITCSPAPCVLPPTQVTDTGYFVANASVVADPVNSKNLLFGSLGGKCGSMGFYFSSDGGSTWSLTNCMGNIITNNGVYYPAGESMVAYDLHGNAYSAGAYIDSQGQGFDLIVVQRSSDGVNWTGPHLAMSLGAFKLLYSWFTVDTNPQSPWANSLYVSTVSLLEPAQARSQVIVARSHDGGRTWKNARVAPKSLYPAEDLYTNIAAGKDGTVYVMWQHCPAGGPNADCMKDKAYMLFSKSTDGGKTWSAPATVAEVPLAPNACNCGAGTLPNTNVVIYNYPIIAVDNSNGPYSGNLYVTMYSWTGTYMQVQVVRSTDGGNTWSAPVLVAPPSATHDQFFPWLSVSSTGIVGVSWLDRRNDPANVNYQPFAAISRDGGQTFAPNIMLNSSFSNPNIGGENYMGDYAGNTWDGSNFIVAWMDSSNGETMVDVVGGAKLR
jgi:hypothetical protein